MASNGIRDRVAIVGMGCTSFGERWDKSVGDLLVDAATEAVASAHIDIKDVDAYWFGTLFSGNSGLTLSRPLKIDYKPVSRLENYCATGSEAFRNACYAVASGAYDVAMAIGGEKLKDSGYSGSPRLAHQRRRHARAAHRARDVQPPRPRLREEVRRERRAAQGSDDAHRVEEPQERRPQPARAVPQGSAEGHDRVLAAGGRAARDLRLLRRERRRRGGDHRARRGRAPLHRQADLREGAQLHRGTGGGADRSRLRLHASSTRSSPPRPTRTRRPASRIRARSWRWRKCTTASRRPSSC